MVSHYPDSALITELFALIVRGAIEQLKIPQENDNLAKTGQVLMSIDHPPEPLTNLTDKALFKARKHGKNQIFTDK
jgi:hypothetical protein